MRWTMRNVCHTKEILPAFFILAFCICHPESHHLHHLLFCSSSSLILTWHFDPASQPAWSSAHFSKLWHKISSLRYGAARPSNHIDAAKKEDVAWRICISPELWVYEVLRGAIFRRDVDKFDNKDALLKNAPFTNDSPFALRCCVAKMVIGLAFANYDLQVVKMSSYQCQLQFVNALSCAALQIWWWVGDRRQARD